MPASFVVGCDDFDNLSTRFTTTGAAVYGEHEKWYRIRLVVKAGTGEITGELYDDASGALLQSAQGISSAVRSDGPLYNGIPGFLEWNTTPGATAYSGGTQWTHRTTIDNFIVLGPDLTHVVYDQAHHDRATLDVTLTDQPTTYTLHWTPAADQTTVYAAIIGIQTNGTYGRSVYFNNVEVAEVIGHELPATNDFELQTVTFPSLFSTRYQTPYRLRLLNGTIRPIGIRHERYRTLDLTLEVGTALRALGILRNASIGELEFRAELEPPRVNHHQARGIDHAEIEGGLDLRFGKNISTRRRSSSTLDTVNRLIVVGYGDEATQLVHEVRSLKDVQGRIPSDTKYRTDAAGRPPEHPDWEAKTGGTSEDIYGPRYGIYRDQVIDTLYQAQILGSDIVELSAWPTEVYEVTVTDLDEIPSELDVGDYVLIRYGNADLRRRVVEITTDISNPRVLELVLGETVPTVAKEVERVQKDVETVLSAINQTD